MNCEQFDQRIQQQLDRRADLGLDIRLQRHAQQCRKCAYSLTLYQCLVDDSTIHPENVVHAVNQSYRNKVKWGFGAHVFRIRPKQLGFAMAAILLICILPMTSPPSDQPPIALQLSQEFPDQLPQQQSGAQKFNGSLNMQDLIAASVTPSWAVNQDIDFSGISQIDFVSFIPEEPINAVRMLPATLETIQPIYQYSVEFPVVNYWSSGLNYALALIRHKLQSPGDADDQQPPKALDLGTSDSFSRRFMC